LSIKNRAVPTFRPPKHKRLADIIHIDLPQNAEKSAKKLSEIWNEETDAKRRLLIKAVSEAIQKIKAQLARTDLSEKEQHAYEQVAEIYKGWLGNHSLQA
jgi:hypothetical protein